jgi:hypothetical protein
MLSYSVHVVGKKYLKCEMVKLSSKKTEKIFIYKEKKIGRIDSKPTPNFHVAYYRQVPPFHYDNKSQEKEKNQVKQNGARNLC